MNNLFKVIFGLTVLALLLLLIPRDSALAFPPAQEETPLIPHTLQGRTNCLSCHAAGVSGAAKVPPSHAGRTNDTCRTCHKTSPTSEIPLVIPTPVARVQATTRDTCVECHTREAGKSPEIVPEWKSSIHSERNVACADCHGGNATADKKEDAHSVKAGYVGKPKTVDVPALCASCHARVESMRQYDLPTDQWAKYLTSTHGEKLAQGDTNVATCFVCHDRHGTKKAQDPSSQVYALNVPGLCASCHSNVELMKPYKIPTNQYQLYAQSVHGIALLQKQNMRAPSCAVCHGTHGAAPPGFEEVANVCGSCHTATQDYYLKSKHASDKAGTPKCVTCHGRYDVGVPSEAMFTGAGERDCTTCHANTTPPAKAIQDLSDQLTASDKMLHDAEAALKRAADSALIVAPEELTLREARTNLITARAAQHTLNLTTVKQRTDKANAAAKKVLAAADKAMNDNILRRQFMAVGLAVLALAVTSLWIVRRELYRQLPPKE
ncbi:MAG: cytochrome c3 family protein [Chloroflexi bacterium]|nr:cytochrome c3 family protein [Chloroflexota bacterium]